MHISTLIDQVLLDAEVHDVEASISYNSNSHALGASYKDDVGTIRYYVPDVAALQERMEVEKKADRHASPVDVFWLVLNTDYKLSR